MQLQRIKTYDTAYDALDPSPFVQDAVRCLSKRGFCTFSSGLSEDQAGKIVNESLKLGEWRAVPAELADGLLGPESCGRMVSITPEHPHLELIDNSVGELLGLFSLCSEGLMGCKISARTGSFLLETGKPTGTFPQLTDGISWLETLTWQKLMVLCFLGPSGGSLTLKPFDEEAESFELQVHPGMWVILRADALAHTFRSQSSKSYVLTCFFLQDTNGGSLRNMSSAGKVPSAKELEAKLMHLVAQAKEEAEDEDAFQAIVTREVQRSANHMFHKGDQVAVRGQACKTAGAINNYRDFWQVVYTGIDSATGIPMNRWDNTEYLLCDSELCIDAKKSYSNHSCFAEDLESFDNKCFSLSVVEAGGMDPHQRQVLEVGYEALIDAGWNKKTLMRSWTGVCTAATQGEYDASEFANQTSGGLVSTSASLAITSNRISYCLGLMGPNFAIDLESAGSLVALVQSADQVQPGKLQADQSLAAGVEFVLSVRQSLYMSWAGLLSLRGRALSFNDTADGFIRGESVGGIVVNMLVQEIDGKVVVNEAPKIDGIISGARSGHSGRSAGLGTPNGPSDMELFAETIKRAHISPLDVDIVECHGVGRILADAVEVAATAKVYRGALTSEMLALSSSKTFFGNCGAGAGICTILKVLGTTHWGVASPTLHLEIINPSIDLNDHTEVFFPTEAVSNRSFASFAAASANSWSGSGAHVIFHGTVDSDKLQSTRVAPRDPAKELIYWPGGGGFLDRDKKPLREYTIVGSWSGWEPEAMQAEGKGSYGHTITLGESGFDRFQIWLDGNSDRVLHPNVQAGGRDIQVYGPVNEAECFGSCWQIDGRYQLQWQGPLANAIEEGPDEDGAFVKVCGQDVGEPGDQYRVRLDTLGKYRIVTWEKMLEDGEELSIKGLVRKGRFSIIGSFTGWAPQEMQREDIEGGVLYVCDVTLTHAGDEFQIVVDEDSRRALYPEMYGAGPGAVLGPDELGVGRVWKLQGVSGESFRIVLERTVQSDVMTTTVHWIPTGQQPQPAPRLPVSYYVIGDWDHWSRPLRMSTRDNVYVLERRMPLQGAENFIILCDGSYAAQIYPSMFNSNPYEYHVIHGPSADGWQQGYFWTVGAHALDEQRRGQAYEIILEVTDSASPRPKKVTWAHGLALGA